MNKLLTRFGLVGAGVVLALTMGCGGSSGSNKTQATPTTYGSAIEFFENENSLDVFCYKTSPSGEALDNDMIGSYKVFERGTTTDPLLIVEALPSQYSINLVGNSELDLELSCIDAYGQAPTQSEKYEVGIHCPEGTTLGPGNICF